MTERKESSMTYSFSILVSAFALVIQIAICEYREVNMVLTQSRQNEASLATNGTFQLSLERQPNNHIRRLEWLSSAI